MLLSDSIAKEISLATKWPVSLNEDYYLLEIPLTKIKNVIGLAMLDGDTFYLNFDDFKSYPISFLVTDVNRTFQYWTKNKRLHRDGNKPALIVYGSSNDSVKKRWAFNGLNHNEHGPAALVGTGYKVENVKHNDADYIVESYQKAIMTWFHNGSICSFPNLCRLQADDLRIVTDVATGKFHAYDNTSSFSAKKIEYSYFEDIPMSSKLDQLVPVKVSIENLKERHDNGVLISRACTVFNCEWKKGTDRINNPGALSSYVETDLINEIGLYDGPFYKNSIIEMAVITKFNETN